MKNKILFLILFISLQNLFFLTLNANEEFIFDVTEIEILEEGKVIKGLKKGTIKTDDGIIIDSDSFLYDKRKNILKAYGNVKIKDINRNIKIFSDEIIYFKNDEKIFSKTNSKAIYDNSKFIYADTFTYEKNNNLLNANGNVKLDDKTQNHLLFTDDLTYFKNLEKIETLGKTKSIIDSKYEINSKNILYLIDENNLSSNFKTIISDNNFNLYKLDKFKYSLNQKILKGKNILFVSEYSKPKSDKFYFADAIFDLNNQKFIAKDTEITMHKNIFGNTDNDPRLKGVSSSGNQNKIVVNKGIFTSCNKDEDCPAWSIKAKKIEHDKTKKQITYENAFLNIYDIPVLYFPKFFHPDPTVERQTGFLKPETNNSNVLGSSITIPYFNVLSENKDFTFKPTLFEDEMFMPQIEYRQENQNSSFSADLGFVNNYNSTSTKKKKNLSHLFAKYDLDLKLENFKESNLSMALERVSDDSYLKVFSPHITKSKILRPKDFDKLNNSLKLFLDHEKYTLESGVETFETLNSKSSDKYQYVFPYYNFNTTINQNYFDGKIDLNSSGANDLNNTNKLESNIINDLIYNSNEFFSELGFRSNFSLNFKNLNSLGKSSTKYKSSPQIELVSLFNAETSLPLIKNTDNYKNLLTPKLSLRFNPSDMKNYSDSNNRINVDNIFSTNRLGLSDTFEAGRSLTLGLEFLNEKKNSLNDVNNFFEFKLATVLRDKEENFISEQSTLNKKNSNIFGSLNKKFSENINIKYNFSLDNNYSTFEYNDLNATFSVNNIITNFNFIEENNEVGNTNVMKTSISYNPDNQNFFTFSTRRNRKINLTEYYDLVYEYKNDCLIAGIKYNKTYYSDRDLKPSENLLFTISLVPLTTYEYEADKILGN